MLVVSRQQLGFGIQTAPTVGQRQVDRRFEVNAGRFRHVVIRVNKMGNLSIEMGIERTDIILVVVDVELRLSRIELLDSRSKTGTVWSIPWRQSSG